MEKVDWMAVERVRSMEAALDAVQKALDDQRERENPEVQEKLRLLADYMDSGQWLRDYELDEAGRLPPDLKRGVLAQDTLYDLLSSQDSE